MTVVAGVVWAREMSIPPAAPAASVSAKATNSIALESVGFGMRLSFGQVLQKIIGQIGVGKGRLLKAGNLIAHRQPRPFRHGGRLSEFDGTTLPLRHPSR